MQSDTKQYFIPIQKLHRNGGNKEDSRKKLVKETYQQAFILIRCVLMKASPYIVPLISMHGDGLW